MSNLSIATLVQVGSPSNQTDYNCETRGSV